LRRNPLTETLGERKNKEDENKPFGFSIHYLLCSGSRERKQGFEME
jgi:hypothetical protein